jgi:exodeoxyribonuclease V alpha subunit
MYTLSEASNDGHCFLPRAGLLEKASAMLETDEARLGLAVGNMLTAGDIHLEEPGKIYLMPFYHSERGVCQRIADIMVTPPTFRSGVAEAEADGKSGITYDEVQKEAIRLALQSKVIQNSRKIPTVKNNHS